MGLGAKPRRTPKGKRQVNGIKSLAELQVGESCRVLRILSIGAMRRRLQDLGIIEGTQVECLHKSPWGDPVAYLIRGTAIALRCEDSSNILIADL